MQAPPPFVTDFVIASEKTASRPPTRNKSGALRKVRKEIFDEPRQCDCCGFTFHKAAQYSGHKNVCKPDKPWDGHPNRRKNTLLPGAISAGTATRKRKVVVDPITNAPVIDPVTGKAKSTTIKICHSHTPRVEGTPLILVAVEHNTNDASTREEAEKKDDEVEGGDRDTRAPKQTRKRGRALVEQSETDGSSPAPKKPRTDQGEAPESPPWDRTVLTIMIQENIMRCTDTESLRKLQRQYQKSAVMYAKAAKYAALILHLHEEKSQFDEAEGLPHVFMIHEGAMGYPMEDARKLRDQYEASADLFAKGAKYITRVICLDRDKRRVEEEEEYLQQRMFQPLL